VPMPKDRYEQVAGRFVQFPVIIGSIVLVYNIPELTYSKIGKYLNLTSEVISLIYMGEIKQWCDPRIKALNPGLADKLPCKDIVAVHRSDGSGTTAAFTLYLTRAYQPWNQTVGWGYTVNWPADEKAKGTGAKGNEGVAQAVLQTPYSIGYVEYAYWAKNKDKYDKVDPIMSFVYVFLWKDYAAEGYGDAAAKAALLKEFFKWVLTEGQKQENVVEGYIPLPSEVAKIGLEALNHVRP
jgi:phosphate transport system substrate-binding protein